MPLTEKEIANMKQLIRDQIENYPDLGGMVAEGKLSYKSGWYEANSKEAFDVIIQHAASVRVSKKGKTQIKVRGPSKRLKALAEKV
ncbi:hypothetical protein OIN59_24635 [Acidovorax sp. D2M1]|uniref:Uncharacterized protein n=1 Tax=Acidovorax benzenivorans TaxID=2987520 RepID=A0ABT5S3U9_9BURK|nr:hypothetical protein [Acidovorax benzenivorans]MDD2180634.1 hypothetical protein [Acidovorax benzenivorans]